MHKALPFFSPCMHATFCKQYLILQPCVFCTQNRERREKELHEAYKNARSREEADSILQQYIERFTISEAVLERLEMPKILERSHSAEPNSPSPPKDPNPLRYLRQQSLPAPKYTAKVEATIAPASGLEATISTGRSSPSKPFVSKAVPMLTPKPYTQPKNTQQVFRTFKVGWIILGDIAWNGMSSWKLCFICCQAAASSISSLLRQYLINGLIDWKT